MALFLWNVVWPGGDVTDVHAVAQHLDLPVEDVRAARLLKKSLDARSRRPVWRATYRVEVADESAALALARGASRLWSPRDAMRYGEVDVTPARRDWSGVAPVVVVGAGPAGLFAALALAESGADVILLERGQPVAQRVAAVNGHWRGTLPLDEESNVVFGEGGAGTFSDGKIYTRRRDGELGYIFTRLVDFGADASTLTDAWAHLGTDRVRKILPEFRRRLIDLGVQVRFGARVDQLLVVAGRAVGVRIGEEEIRASRVVIAAGHSARDTATMLCDAGLAAEARPIAIGARIEHPQELVDAARYHGPRGELPPASYRLTHSPKVGRKVHTFCMCPGGMVVPASNLRDHVVVNGMSFAARRAFWANSAVVVEVRPEDFGGHGPLAGFAYQDRIERACAALGGGGDRAPAQYASDFLAGRPSSDLPKVSYPCGVAPVDLAAALPEIVVRGLRSGLRSFEKDLTGFSGARGVLIAPETRTTSPVRFLRTDTRESTTVSGAYPCGEGAGFGGGIVSCALDGFRAARAIMASLD